MSLKGSRLAADRQSVQGKKVPSIVNANREPTANDIKYNPGTIWIYVDSSLNKYIYTLAYVSAGSASWTQLNSEGFVSGPLSSTDNAIPRFDGTDGVTIQDSAVIIDDNGIMTNANQPAFFAYFAADQVAVTGDGTVYAPVWDTERFDNNSDYDTGTGLFTAPVTGKYWLYTQGKFNMLSGTNEQSIDIVTTGNSYQVSYGDANAMAHSQVAMFKGGCFADMTAGDTAYVTFTNSNGALDNDLVADGSFFEGFLVC